ncbi:MAG TPA: FAD-dependent oxidoreductase [Acidimicrobiales bacterium]|nr:FAD-dependent oxidoreductase [Acidimicrobiales bacterium]
MDTWTEPARDVPVAGRPDVVVVGAGCAGIAAALASARRGADTWLVERSGIAGGLATVGLINLLLTLDDGDGSQVVAGICQEFVDRLDARGQAHYPPRSEWASEEPEVVDRWRRWGLVWGAPESVRYSVAYDPEAFVDAAYEALSDAGVKLRLHTHCARAVTAEGRIDAVLLESKRGREAVVPHIVVDTTGDGDVMASAGADFELVPIPPHLWFRAGGVDVQEAEAGRSWFVTTGKGRVLVPWGPAAERVDPCDPDDMTRAELACRAGARAAFESLRGDVPGFADAWLDDYARMLGITESRRLVGDYVLRKEDADLRFPDAVARTGHWTRRQVVFDIPYRCLTTAVADNLLVAGRCISTTRYVHQATKEIPAAMATGEAAGAAAARAASAGVAARGLDVSALRRDLAAAGAIVGGPA